MLCPQLQVWEVAAAEMQRPLSPDEKWQLGTKLIADAGDLAAAKRVHAETNNYYRLLRVLEIVLHTGKALSEFEADPDAVQDYDFRY